LKLTLLGTGTPIPDADRAGAATLVEANGVQLLFDCGRGVLMRLAAAAVLPPMLHRVFLTHLHSDHVCDFNDVVTTHWVMSQRGTTPLPVTGPPGTRDFCELTVAMLRDDIAYRIAHHDDLDAPPACDVTEVLDGVALETDAVRVIAAPTDHRPVAPTVGYRVESGGSSIVVAGDTVPCDGLDQLCAGADVYVQTVLRPSLVQQVPSARFQDVLDYHSSCADAGRTAAKAGAKTLVLTHMIPACPPGTEQPWIEEAAAEFDGEILVGHDLLSIEL
jgi:ribonuclease Z